MAALRRRRRGCSRRAQDPVDPHEELAVWRAVRRCRSARTQRRPAGPTLITGSSDSAGLRYVNSSNTITAASAAYNRVLSIPAKPWPGLRR